MKSAQISARPLTKRPLKIFRALANSAVKLKSSTVDIMLTPTPVFYLLKRGKGGNKCDIGRTFMIFRLKERGLSIIL